jgi:hypothetical protein
MERRKHMWDWLVIMMPLMLPTKLASSKPWFSFNFVCNSLVQNIWEKNCECLCDFNFAVQVLSPLVQTLRFCVLFIHINTCLLYDIY